jgi:hypothetical protein
MPQVVRRFRGADDGIAAAEMAIWMAALSLPIVNLVDLGAYAYKRMQVETAAHAAVNAAWHDCNPYPSSGTAYPPPAVAPCKVGLVTDMQNAAQSTTLGTGVSLPSASISEGYYCATASGSLTLMASLGTAASPVSPAPAQPKCTGTTKLAGDYVKAAVSYTYTPIISGASLISLLGTTITQTAWMRLDK